MSHEAALLASMIRDNSLVDQLHCQPEDFEDQTYQLIHSACKQLITAGEVADIITISDYLKKQTKRNYLPQIGELLKGGFAAVNAPAYHRLMKGKARLRRAQQTGEKLTAVEDEAGISDCLQELMALSQPDVSYDHNQNSSVAAALTWLEEIQAGKKPGLSTGLSELDEKIGGLQPSDLIIIAARSQHGKTALMLNMANSQQCPVGIISGEQPHVQLGLRSIAMMGRVNLRSLRTGRITDEEWTGINKAVQSLHDKNISIYDKGNPDIGDIESISRQWSFHRGIKILFVDFLQLISGGSGKEHRLQIGDVARRLKALAKQLNIPVVALAQISRGIDRKEPGESYLGRMPYTQDIADSAQIEDAADQILCLYRPEVYWPENARLQGLAYVNVAKNRHGPVGFVRAHWAGEFMKFSNYAREYS